MIIGIEIKSIVILFGPIDFKRKKNLELLINEFKKAVVWNAKLFVQ